MARKPSKRSANKRSQNDSRSGDEGAAWNSSRGDQIEEHEDGIYLVRRITGSSSTKSYRCPGCDQMIPTATPHTVAWLEYDIETRRHWHTPCWNSRKRRQPKVERTRNAPRY